MQDDLSIYPGIDFNFSQPITDNVEEAASGVKGSIAVKVFGKDLYESEKLAVQIDKILNTVQGIEDLGVIRNIGQPELRIELNERQLARYGVAKEDVQSIIEMAIGGKSASLLYEDERKFNIMVRYSEEFRQNEEEIGKILVPAMDGTMVPIKELAYFVNRLLQRGDEYLHEHTGQFVQPVALRRQDSAQFLECGGCFCGHPVKGFLIFRGQ